MSAMAVAEVVTFYCVFEGRPSKQRVNCGGGVKVKDANGNIAIVEPMLEAQFSDGKFQTSNPKIIEVLRNKAKNWSVTGITEDREQYLAWILSPEKQASRLAKKLEEANQERNRLKAELEAARKSKEK